MERPRTYRGGGYEVTVNSDRSIHVRPGDWLSKYSMAIYGNFDNIDQFVRKVDEEFTEIEDPHRIDVGEVLYHPAPLPDEPEQVPPGTKPPIKGRSIEEILKILKETFLTTDWTVDGTGGGDLSLWIWSGQYTALDILHKPSSVVTRFHALATGPTFGFPESLTVGGSFSTVHFPSIGTILRSPLYRELTLDDFRQGIIVLELGANWVYVVGGGSLSLLFFGCGYPLSRIVRELRRLLYFGNTQAVRSLLLRGTFSGVAILGGTTLGIPGIGVAARAGFMYDRDYWGL